MRRVPTGIMDMLLLALTTTVIALPCSRAAAGPLQAGRSRHPAVLQSSAPAIQRVFTVAAPDRYRVILSIRSEVEGKRPVGIGAQTYVEGFVRSAEARTSWRATRRIPRLQTDGAADVEESLDDFETIQLTSSPEDDETRKLAAALRSALEAFLVPRTVRYRESPGGQLAGLQAEAVPNLAEGAPPVLTLWLARALRPTVSPPQKPITFGQRWQEPRAVRLEGWNELQGSETGEWLEAPGAGEPAVRLYIAQEISGTVAGQRREDEPAAQARFHADGLATIAMQDGRLLLAERSALRSVSATLEAVPGLVEPQRFAARLSVYIHIQDCRNDPCTAPSRNDR